MCLSDSKTRLKGDPNRGFLSSLLTSIKWRFAWEPSLKTPSQPKSRLFFSALILHMLHTFAHTFQNRRIPLLLARNQQLTQEFGNGRAQKTHTFRSRRPRKYRSSGDAFYAKLAKVW